MLYVHLWLLQIPSALPWAQYVLGKHALNYSYRLDGWMDRQMNECHRISGNKPRKQGVIILKKKKKSWILAANPRFATNKH